MTAIDNLPTIAERPEIDVADRLPRAVCQLYTRDWIDGHGFVFTYCEQPQRYVISWTVADRWRTRRQLRVCHAHGAVFAEMHALGLVGGLSPTPVATAPSRVQDDPFGDPDQPYERVREAGGEGPTFQANSSAQKQASSREKR